MRDGGKGDVQRPLGVSMEKFDASWDAIFKKTVQETIEQNQELLKDLTDHERECGK